MNIISKARINELKSRARLAWKILRARDGNLVAHVVSETAHMRTGEDGPDEWMAASLLDMARTFGTGGHSGMSAGWAISCLTPLLSFAPLGPLRGTDDEWVIHAYDEHMFAQNKRCGHVFQREDRTAYDGEAVIFREPNGCTFISKHSRQTITFPYTPRRVYADVPFDATEAQKEAAANLAWGATPEAA